MLIQPIQPPTYVFHAVVSLNNQSFVASSYLTPTEPVVLGSIVIIIFLSG